ncbi:MAG TPA: hypothetical protein VLK82_15120 [Candidatus Tectomicrobia bacterium]|nr:hypothetical protein [Candidatus Tectomicrobia bacterium]
MTTAATPLSIYQLRIVLRGMSPLIWRRVLVRSEMTLAHLYTLLQIVFAWSNEHLHSFHIHGRDYDSSGALTCRVQLRDFWLHRGERFDTCTTLALIGNAISISKHYDPWRHGGCILSALGARGRGRPRTAGGPGPMWNGSISIASLRRSTRWGVADAISTLLEGDPQTSVRAALGDLDDLREAVDCLETYQAFQPDHFDRGDINRQLLAWGQEGGAVRCR